MARRTQDREDLLRDATGLADRVEIQVSRKFPGSTSVAQVTVVCGFRPGGALSVFWDQAEVVQFNAAGELRRAFSAGRMIAAYRRQLFWLTRQGNAARAILRRTPMSSREQREFLADAKKRLELLAEDIDSQAYKLVGEVPPDAGVCGRVQKWIEQHDLLNIAAHPGLGRS